MDYLEAESIVKKYVDVIAETPTYKLGIRKESCLPISKEKIVIAYKIFIAYTIKFETLTKEEFDNYIFIFQALDSFLNERDVDLVSYFYGLNENEKEDFRFKYPEQHKRCLEVRESIAVSKSYYELIGYMDELFKINTDDKFYCQKIYTLANVEYRPEYKQWFEDKYAVEHHYYDTICKNAEINEVSKKSRNFYNFYMPLLSVLSAIVAIIGYLYYDYQINLGGVIIFFADLYIIGGFVAFALHALYIIIRTVLKDQEIIENIKRDRQFQRTSTSPIYYADNDEEVKGLIKMYLRGAIIGRILTYGIVLFLILYIFGIEGLIFIGIIFGLFYIPEIIKKIIN